MFIETERLILREMTFEDFNDLKEVWGDKENMKFYPYDFDDERINYWIFRNRERFDIFGFGICAVVLKESGKVIGDCGISMQTIDRVIRPEVGYHMNRAYQRKGYIKEAAIACVSWMFKNTPFQMVYSYMEAENLPSYSTAESLGLKFIEEYSAEDGEKLKVYGLSKEEWRKIHHED